MKYVILSSDKSYRLVVYVQNHIREGWKPIGGVSYGDGEYLQAMIKEPDRIYVDTETEEDDFDFGDEEDTDRNTFVFIK